MTTSDPEKSLAAATWRRNFHRDEALLREAHANRVGTLPEELREAADAVKGELHPDQRFDISRNAPSITIQDGTRNLVSCSINTQLPGTLELQFFANANERGREPLTLDRYGEEEYVWLGDDGPVPADHVAEFIVRRLLQYAIEVVHEQTSKKAWSANQFIS